MSGEEIVQTGCTLTDCPLLVVHKHGVGERVTTKHGVPDLDKMTAFRQVAALLAPHGFKPWRSLVEVRTATRPVKDRAQKWRQRDDDRGREDFERWQELAKEDIRTCYTGSHHIVVGYYPDCYADAKQACALLDDLLGGTVVTQLVTIPPDVHGPRATLPRPSTSSPRNRDFAELRKRAWQPFVTEVRRYQSEAGVAIDGVLIVAPEWYDNHQSHDDHVNKRAGRITLAQALRAPVQYLRPEREEGQLVRWNQDLPKAFETRLMMAWRDLAWKTIGRVRVAQLKTVADRVYGVGEGEAIALAPDRILGLGVLQRNETRLTNSTSFVPFAIELDVARGTSSARFARTCGSDFQITPLFPLSAALVELAASGPSQLATGKNGRWGERRERSERFFHTAITEFCGRAKHPLVLIDAVTCRGVWPWVADAKLDPENIIIDGHPHAEADWGDVRIVRVRSGNAPKVLFDRYFRGECAETGEVVCYDAPKWADAQLFKLEDTQAGVYLSFGSLLRTDLIRGSSCYRAVAGLRKNSIKGSGYAPGTIGVFAGAWSTPSAVELTVVRTSAGETSDQLAEYVESLRTLFEHFGGDWSTKPAPLYFERALKEYVADYDFDEESEGEEGEE